MPSPFREYFRNRAREVARSRRRGLPRPRRARFPIGLARSYLRDIVPWLEAARLAVETVLIPRLPALIREANAHKDEARADDFAVEIPHVIDQIKIVFQRRYSKAEAEALAEKYAQRVQSFSAQQIQESFRRVLGVDALLSSPSIEQAVRLATAENVKLITSIPELYFDDIQKLVFEGVRTGMSTSELAEQFEQRYNVSETKAARLARDQIGSMNSAINEAQQRSLGIDGYVWRCSLDERVRGNPGGKYPNAVPSHWDLEGKKFKWSDPPPPGHPGEDYECRCTAEPDFEGMATDEANA